MRFRSRRSLAVVALTFSMLGTLPGSVEAAGAPIPGQTSITLRAAPTQLLAGRPAKLSGVAGGLLPGARLELFRAAYPYRAFTLVRTTTPAPSGAFVFIVFPDRNTRYRVAVPASVSSPTVEVQVAVKVLAQARALPLGRAGVRVLAFHPRDLHWNDARISWWFAHGARGRFLRAPFTRTRRLSAYVTLLSTAITLPAGRYRWRACFHARADHALLDPQRPQGCTGRGYQGGGRLPTGYPTLNVGRAARWLRTRAGRTAFAIIDDQGRMSGVHEHWRFVSASVVKAMLLVAYLRRLHAHGQHYVDSNSNSFLYPMIHVSDNSAATATYSIVGDGGLYSVAYWAGMTDFSVSGFWANAQISAADQARFFFEMDSLIPLEFIWYARWLLSTIADYESWGIPAVGRGYGYRVFFKGGWRGTGLGQLVHQVARLEGHHRMFSLAVMTDGDPSMGYGIDTIQGITGSLL